MKRAFLISNNDWWTKRLSLYAKWFEAHGYEVRYVTSDFNHFTKRPIDKGMMPDCMKFVHVIPYRKNLSIRRIISHCFFSFKVLIFLFRNRPEVVVGVLPCNSLGAMLWLFKKWHPELRLLVDVTDMWPESLPMPKIKQILKPFMAFWRGLRTLGVDAATSGVICECELFREALLNLNFH